MSIDWNSVVRDVVDLGSESYETRMTRTILKAGMVALFLIVVWRLIK